MVRLNFNSVFVKTVSLCLHRFVLRWIQVQRYEPDTSSRLFCTTLNTAWVWCYLSICNMMFLLWIGDSDVCLQEIEQWKEIPSHFRCLSSFDYTFRNTIITTDRIHFFALLRHLFSSMSFQLFLQRTLFTCDVSWMNASVYEILHWLLPRPMLSIHTHSHSHHNSSAFRVLSSEWVCFQPCYNGSLWLSQSTPFRAASRVQLCITVKWLFKSELSLWLQLYCVDCVPTDTSAGSFT